ncbi:hypothetical protein [Longimicrobium sp.]|uniref:hypothetical protein n=1 Tax=Longimicrobium sp. TaxID=2029185 RepID=UPI002E3234DC|nr:hypothetical protein [Longimicrobium sp.]HEX6040647.1 hypothetical protein [Longimicrobium sp.]
MASRARTVRMLTWGLGGFALGLLIVLLVLNIVARTDRGHAFVLQRTLEALGKNVRGGKLYVRDIEGNLFEGAKVYGLRLVDNEGRPFVVADSAYLDYRITTLLSPRIHITRATLYDPEVYVFKLPGDTLWNYQAIFADTTTRDPNEPRIERATLLDTIRMVNGVVRVQTPWSPDSTLSPRAQRAMVADALSDTSLVLVDRVRGGYIRTMNFTRLNGRITRVRFAPGSTNGSRLHVDSLRGVAQIFRDTVRFNQVQGQVALLRAHVELDAPVIALPNSRLSMSGVVRTDSFPEWFNEAEAPMYDIAFRSDSVAFRDLLWLYPRFPREATGQMSLRIENRPEGLMFLGREVDVRARGTHVTGDFGMIVGDTLRFVDVDVEAEPINTAVIERMLPEGLPVQGLRLGGATIQGNRAAPSRTRAEDEARDEMEQAARGERVGDDEAPAPTQRPARTQTVPPAQRAPAPRPTQPTPTRPSGREPGSATEAAEQARQRAQEAEKAGRVREP